MTARWRVIRGNESDGSPRATRRELSVSTEDVPASSCHAVFLRAINVGNRRITMADLRSVFAEVGYPGVATLQAAGNVIVPGTDPPSRSRIEDGIERRFGFRSEAFVRSGRDIAAVVAEMPWSPGDATVEVSFLERPPDPADAATLIETVEEPEELIVSGSHVYFRREGKGIEPVHREATTERILGMRTTRRGFPTVLGMADRMLL